MLLQVQHELGLLSFAYHPVDKLILEGRHLIALSAGTLQFTFSPVIAAC